MNGCVHHYMRIASSTLQNCGISYFIFDDITSPAGSADTQNIVESAMMATGLPLGLDKRFVPSINGIRLPWGRYSLPDSTCTFVRRILICILIVMKYRIGRHSGLPSALFLWDSW